jgi:hypothetical protein
LHEGFFSSLLGAVLIASAISSGSAEACCIDYGDNSSSFDWYEGGRYDDWDRWDSTYGFQDGSLIGRYDSYGIGSTDYWDRSNQESLVPWNGNYNYGPADPLYRAGNYAGTEYDSGLGSYYDYDSYGNRSYHETVRPLDSSSVRHGSWLGEFLQNKPWSFEVDLTPLCGFLC